MSVIVWVSFSSSTPTQFGVSMVAAVSTRTARRRFEAIYPRIHGHLQVSFAGVRCPASRDDLLAEAVGLAWIWSLRLARRGRDPSRFPISIARYAARAARAGRRVVGSESARDVLSSVARRRHGVRVGPLVPRSEPATGRFRFVSFDFDDALRENAVTPVPRQVEFRLDWPAFVSTLTRRNRTLVGYLACGYSTGETAARFRISAGRVSQLRREWHAQWIAFGFVRGGAS